MKKELANIVAAGLVGFFSGFCFQQYMCKPVECGVYFSQNPKKSDALLVRNRYGNETRFDVNSIIPLNLKRSYQENRRPVQPVRKLFVKNPEEIQI